MFCWLKPQKSRPNPARYSGACPSLSLGRDSPVPVGLAVATIARPTPALSCQALSGDPDPSVLPRRSLSISKGGKDFPKGQFLNWKKKHTKNAEGVRGTFFYHLLYKLELGVNGRGTVTWKSHLQTGFQESLKVPQTWGPLKTPTSSTVFP